VAVLHVYLHVGGFEFFDELGIDHGNLRLEFLERFSVFVGASFFAQRSFDILVVYSYFFDYTFLQ